MGIKRITTSVALLLLMFSAAQAQEIKTDSVGNNTESRNGQADSLQILSAELAQIKSQLSSEEKEPVRWKSHTDKPSSSCIPLWRSSGNKQPALPSRL